MTIRLKQSDDSCARSTLAARILQRADQLGLSKKDLARKAGLSRQTLDNLLLAEPIGGRMLPSIPTLMSLSVALRLHPFWLTDAIFEERRLPSRVTRMAQGDRGGFVCDTTCPDGCVIEPGAVFRKVWTNQILSSHDYSRRKIICWDDKIEVTVTRPDGSQYPANRLIPRTREAEPTRDQCFAGGVIDTVVEFVAPQQPGVAFSYWRVVEADGTLCFSESAGMWVIVYVEPSSARRAPFPGATLSVSSTDSPAS